MKKTTLRAALIVAVLTAGFSILGAHTAEACTNFIITRGASTDGSVMVSYAADSHQLFGALYKYNAPKKAPKPGTMIDVVEWDTGKFLGRIPQAAKTYSTVGNMNELGVLIGETTFTGIEKLHEPNGIMDYAVPSE